ncbi:hypothetical protein V5N11_001176 [Cardamine amara subsp. amara]|uniref:Uncharacterized protein n=1 Tax=Cardamine amara subsp. amara TaxID=228776 RepID=A0ABD0ZTZ5_CARAN
MEAEKEGNLTIMKLPVLPLKPNSHSHSLSSPIHSSMAASVPFSWEEEPGKPKQNSSSSSSSFFIFFLTINFLFFIIS